MAERDAKHWAEGLRLIAMPDQFALPLMHSPRFTDIRFMVAPCNEQAFDFVRRWPDWPAPAAALFGPSGCGKTHLAHVWRMRADALLIEVREFAAKFAAARKSTRPLVIEDLDREPPDAAREHQLIELLDHPRRTVLFTGSSPPQEWPCVTGDWKSRAASLLAFGIDAPDDGFLSALARNLFAARQLTVPPQVAELIVTRLERTPDAIAGFVAAADQKAFCAKRPVSLRLVLEMLDETGADGLFAAEPAEVRPV
jgi:chromosomal replication initiation ATPase DnaA